MTKSWYDTDPSSVPQPVFEQALTAFGAEIKDLLMELRRNILAKRGEKRTKKERQPGPCENAKWTAENDKAFNALLKW
jgi:hypothetical protein